MSIELSNKQVHRVHKGTHEGEQTFDHLVGSEAGRVDPVTVHRSNEPVAPRDSFGKALMNLAREWGELRLHGQKT